MKNLKIMLLKLLKTINAHYLKFKPISFIKDFFIFTTDYFKFKRNRNDKFSFGYFYPCLNDKGSTTPIDIHYFYQDTWAAKKIFELKPKNHYDIGSHAKTISILSQFIPITMVDIRPLPIVLPNLKFIKADVTNLPFRDNSIDSISSLCVIEHIGLGRYGDKIDAFGSEKAISEIKRVVKEEKYIYGEKLINKYKHDFGTGLYMFKKES
jgi:SAM-dependent methyltransferase